MKTAETTSRDRIAMSHDRNTTHHCRRTANHDRKATSRRRARSWPRPHTAAVLFVFALIASPFVLPLSLAAQSPDADPVVGEWTGAISAGGQTLRLILTVSGSASGDRSAILTSVDQGNAEIPVDVITVEGDTVWFSIAAVDGSYEGELAADERSIDGMWTQMGNTLPLVFERSDAP